MNAVMSRLCELASVGKLGTEPVALDEELRTSLTDNPRWVWVDADLPEAELRLHLGINGQNGLPIPIGSGSSGREKSFLVWPLDRLVGRK